jgi:hypothetical protein
MLLTSITLVLVTAAAQPAAKPPTKGVMTVQVEVAPGTGGGAQAWGKELRTALEARTDEFRFAKPGEKAALVVRIDSVVPGQAGSSVMNGALVQGGQPRPFTLNYPGEIRPQAEKLARGLRKLAEQAKAEPSTPPKK